MQLDVKHNTSKFGSNYLLFLYPEYDIDYQ